MTLPTFTEFYKAVHDGQSPFPWQVGLAEEVLQRGWNHRLLDLPTGSGKTSAFDIALYCLACAPDRMPRRTLLVVDRRIVVDQGAKHARGLCDALRHASDGPAFQIAQALRSTCIAADGDSCVDVAVLRGGMPRDNDWARRPDRPVLGVSTVDQVGSRLLFRGYGVSRLSAPIFAGLLGNDTLVLLDEVHLAVPFAHMLDTIHEQFRSRHPDLPSRFAVVQMSATAGARTGHKAVFRLAPADESHPILEPRLTAHKLASLLPVKVAGDDEDKKRHLVAEHAVAEAIDLQRAGARVVAIIVNRVDTARIALALLETKHKKETDALLLTGRMRPIDRDDVVRRELARAAAGRTRTKTDAALVVVATQCIEAGADLDFDGIVTECASLDALRQRFGRVDRRGDLRETRSVILGRSDLVANGAEDPIYGGAVAATWAWLSAQATDNHVDFGIRFLPKTAQTDVLPPVPDAPVLMPAHLDAWAQTSVRMRPDADVAPWLHGPQRPKADVQIVWRTLPDLTDSDGRMPTSRDEIPDSLFDLLEAVRPSSLEAISIPIAAAKRWLTHQDAIAIADVIAGDPEDDAEAWRRGPTVATVVAVRWDGEESEFVAVSDIAPGDVLVVDRRSGGWANNSFDPEARTPVLDVGDLAQLRARGIPTLRLDAAALAAWCLPEDVVKALPQREPNEPQRDFEVRLHEWIERWPESPPPAFLGTDEEWKIARTELRSKRARVREAGSSYVLVAKALTVEQRGDELTDMITEDDDSSFRARPVSLDEHSQDVQSLAKQYAEALYLGTHLSEDLALAGWFHDVGKADPRFQRWLAGGDEIRQISTGTLLAKSGLPSGDRAQRQAARKRAGYPNRYRHELLSLAMVAANESVLARAHDPALVLHLVASHHGWCRPFAPPIDDAEDLVVTFSHRDETMTATTRHQLARLDRGVADRYWEVTARYGWWGLAWLEAILRLADHRASQQREVSND
jgi:CRISPR-associated endonuclease/helicase Cas3